MKLALYLFSPQSPEDKFTYSLEPSMSLITRTTSRSIFIGGKSYVCVHMIFMQEYTMLSKVTNSFFFFLI